MVKLRRAVMRAGRRAGTPEVDGGPVSVLHVPGAVSGLNAFSTMRWWQDAAAGAAAPGVVDVAAPGAGEGGVSLRVREVSWEGTRTLLLSGPIVEMVGEASVQGVEDWFASLRAVVAAAPHGAVQLSVRTAVDADVVSVAALTALAEGRRWPAPVEPSPGDFADQLRDAATEAAQACVARSLAPDPRTDAVLSRVLRDLCRRRLDEVEMAGLGISGPRDALLWPVHRDRDEIPMDVATDAATEVLRLQLESRPLPAGKGGVR